MVAAPKIRRDDKGKQQEFAEKKGKNSAGKVRVGKKSDGGGVVLKMKIIKMRAKRDQLPYFPFLIKSLFFNFFIRQNFFLILSSINFLILAPFPFGPWSKKKDSNWPAIGLQTLSILQLCPCKLGQKSFLRQESLLSH